MMKVEIWSDYRCPFCYLGKKRFEAALKQFPQRDQVKVEWRSFQLDPYLVTQPDKNVYEHLAEQKGITKEESIQAHEQIVFQAHHIGLDFNFDKVVVANSFNAHRLTHLAKLHNLQDEIEERLFKAYFSEGKNINDPESIMEIGKEVGIPVDETEKMLNSEEFSDNVLMDETYAREIGIAAVPYFLFNEKIAVRGAHSPETFLRALIKSLEMMNAPETIEDKAKRIFFRGF